MKRFEYKIIDATSKIDNIDEIELNRLGNEGWEAVTIHFIPSTDSFLCGHSIARTKILLKREMI